jgi:hypothetical protein
MNDAEAISIRDKVFRRIMATIKETGVSPCYAYCSSGTMKAIWQAAGVKDQYPIRDMVGGVMVSAGMGCEDDEVAVILKYKL